MSEKLSKFFSTYGLITAQKALEKCHINLNPEELLQVLKEPTALYYHVLQLPLGNIYNGIILQQIQDYQLFAQKLFIDYLLHAENEKKEQGGNESSREEITQKRLELINYSEQLQDMTLVQEKLIAQSQKAIIEHMDRLSKAIRQHIKAEDQHKLSSPLTSKMIHALLMHHTDLHPITDAMWEHIKLISKEALSEQHLQLISAVSQSLSSTIEDIVRVLAEYNIKIKEMFETIKQFRDENRQFVLHLNELIYSIPDYGRDEEKNKANLEALTFDDNLGK